jgi:hypothetical protein
MEKSAQTVDLLKTAEAREYTKFEEIAKEALKEKLYSSEAFKELNKKLSEACNKKLKEDDDEDDEDEKGDEEEEIEDDKDSTEAKK